MGHDFIVFDDHLGVAIDLDDDPIADFSHKVTKTREEGFVLHPQEFVLGCTRERIDIPANVVARLEGKSSIGRLGLLIHVTAGFVDPGWEGRLTLEIYNVRRKPIILRPGKPFCQLSFQYMESAAAKPYSGRYQSANEVQSSRYNQIKDWEPYVNEQSLIKTEQ